MAAPIASARPETFGTRTRRWFAGYWNLNLLLGLPSIGTLGLLWEFARLLGLPAISNVPPAFGSGTGFRKTTRLGPLLGWVGAEFSRITAGFLAAQIVGIPLGLMMAMHRGLFDMTFPVVEILRPIPPVAWISISIIFWPTRELSVVFIVFLGAFWIVLLNTIGGASNIDPNYKTRCAFAWRDAARSLLADHPARNPPLHHNGHGGWYGDRLGDGGGSRDGRGPNWPWLFALAIF